jgi:hypothetical protein
VNIHADFLFGTFASDTASWRLPVGESGLLDFFLSTGVFSVEGESGGEVLPLKLKKQALRLVGNTCAECGEFLPCS